MVWGEGFLPALFHYHYILASIARFIWTGFQGRLGLLMMFHVVIQPKLTIFSSILGDIAELTTLHSCLIVVLAAPNPESLIYGRNRTWTKKTANIWRVKAILVSLGNALLGYVFSHFQGPALVLTCYPLRILSHELFIRVFLFRILNCWLFLLVLLSMIVSSRPFCRPLAVIWS